MAKGNKWGAISGQMARIADQGRAEREASKAHEAMTSKPDKAVTETESVPAAAPVSAAPAMPNKPTLKAEGPGAPVAFGAKRDTTETVIQVNDGTPEDSPVPPTRTARKPAKVQPEPVIETDKAKKKSTSLYLSGAASRALHTIAAQQGVRPHRVLDDALRAEFRRHGLDFDDLNAKD